MTIALISIPHQTQARIHWFHDRDELIEHALCNAIAADDDEPIEFDDAIAYLADDWHGHILIESVNDLLLVLRYHGHQAYRVCAMFRELQDEFLPQEVHTDDS